MMAQLTPSAWISRKMDLYGYSGAPDRRRRRANERAANTRVNEHSGCAKTLDLPSGNFPPRWQLDRTKRRTALGESPHVRATGSEMNTLRKVLAIACITPLAAFGVGACGGNKTGGGGGGGGGGGDINVALTLFPVYIDPP